MLKDNSSNVTVRPTRKKVPLRIIKINLEEQCRILPASQHDDIYETINIRLSDHCIWWLA
jgi:hypothetical protein